MARVALMTVGLLVEVYSHPSMKGFVDAGDPTFGAAEANAGFIARSLWPDPVSTAEWGEALVPKVFKAEINAGERNTPILSLWKDLESVYAFAYSGPHAQALRRRKEWFMPHDFPGYVLWWVGDNHIPQWSEADQRYDILCQKGASPEAFDFKHPFDADGQATQINRDGVRKQTEQREATMQYATVQEIIRTYLSAWNEPDAAAREKFLQTIWGNDATYTDPISHATTLAELNTIIGQFLKANPGATFSIVGPITNHHQSLRFFWTLQLANGTTIEGMDYGEIDENGKLAKIVGFF